VDANDSFDSESAAANGVALRQLLWVRCKDPGKTAKPWARLDQALRATDLLLQAGGFAAIVLDLGSTAPEHGARIPLATWFRFRQAADRTRCSLLVLAQEPLAQSSAAVVLECAAPHEQARGELRFPALAIEKNRKNGARGISGGYGAAYYAQECGQTVLRDRAYQVRIGRAASHPSTLPIAGKRKPPAADWSAAAAWQREETA
jgi:hypothetical protein